MNYRRQRSLSTSLSADFSSQKRMKVRIEATEPVLREPGKDTFQKVKKIISVFPRQVCFKRFNFPLRWEGNGTVPVTCGNKKG